MITTEDIKAFAEKAIKPAKEVELGSTDFIPRRTSGLTRLHNEITVAEVREILAEEGGVGRDC